MKNEYKKKREKMVKSLVDRGYIETSLVEEAMKKVPRHEFVPSNIKDRAYTDRPQPIGEGQTISAPHMVAMMVENLDIEEGQRVLEVGGGRGYHAAVIAELVGENGEVYTIEFIETLARSAQKRLEGCGYQNVRVVHGDGSSGYQEKAPYDRISVACGASKIPDPMVKQLKVGGKILLPLGSRFFQKLVKATKIDEYEIKKENLGGVRFVPLKGEYGF
ncbi:MAG: protein-L-isoaspartate O-methyltransferase [Candidatus Thermoplasmatota archaeon]